MKIRTDFVTNSSSSVFFLSIRLNLKDKRKLSCKLEGCPEGIEYGEINVRMKAEDVKNAATVDDLILLLRQNILDFDREIFTDTHPFIQKLRKSMKSVDEIESIELTGKESSKYYGENGEFQDTLGVTTKYSFVTRKSSIELEGSPFDSGDSGGGFIIDGCDLRNEYQFESFTKRRF